jgi:WhiB family redox-sensing transcriptional regulator
MTTPTRRARTQASPLAEDWRKYAACAQVDGELFFPTGNGAITKRQTANAKRVCGPCPVRKRCLEWALETGQHTGVWGGLDEHERRGLTRVRESSMTRCMNAQDWIEEQQSRGVGQNEMARQLGVDRGVLCRAIQRFNEERATAGSEVSA